MKNLTTFCYVLFSVSLMGQTIDFADKNFETSLLQNKVLIDLNRDNKIQIEEAEKVTSLTINSANISELTEIKYFKNLVELNCNDNNIHQLDVDMLHKLKTLYCRGNKIDTLRVFRLQELEELICGQNKMKEIILDELPKLKKLYCQENNLKQINLSKVKSLVYLEASNNQIQSLDITSSSEMFYFNLSDNGFNELDISKCRKLNDFYIDPEVKLKKGSKQNYLFATQQ